MATQTSDSATGTATAAAAAAGGTPECPVDGVVSRRIRALRKKLNRILQMEEALADGKTLNREQEEVLRSKPTVLALIDELERLRQPLAEASALLSSPASAPPPQKDDVADLVSLLYFSTLFNVSLQGEFGKATMLAREHERGCCLTYDYVTEDASESDLLGEADLDAVAELGVMVTSRPIVAEGVSHKDALDGCLRHARFWLEGAEVPIRPGGSVTYAGLRAKLSKILASDYYTIATEMKSTGDVAAAVGQYGGLQISEDNSVQRSEDDHESSLDAEMPLENQSECVEKTLKDEVVNEHVEKLLSETENETHDCDVIDAYQSNSESKEQQYISRKPYQNQQGGRGPRGVGGRRGGYPNGRSMRGGRGTYQNGRNQFYDSGYYPRNYYNNRGRGGRSGGGPAMYNNYGGQPHATYVPAGEG